MFQVDPGNPTLTTNISDRQSQNLYLDVADERWAEGGVSVAQLFFKGFRWSSVCYRLHTNTHGNTKTVLNYYIVVINMKLYQNGCTFLNPWTAQALGYTNSRHLLHQFSSTHIHFSFLPEMCSVFISSFINSPHVLTQTSHPVSTLPDPDPPLGLTWLTHTYRLLNKPICHPQYHSNVVSVQHKDVFL